MRKQEAMKSQAHTCVLRVDNIHCDGCKGKIRKLLRKIDGVLAISIDMEQGRVAVTGNVDPALLIRKLEKSGKHAEIWRNNHNNNNNKSLQFDSLNNQFRSLQVGNLKGGGGDKKHYNKYQPSAQEMKGYKDLKSQKTVKFDLPKKHHGFDDDFSEDGEFDEDFSDEDEDFDDEEFGFGGRQHSQKPVNGGRKVKAVVKEKKKGGKKGKKEGGGGGFMAMLGKAIGGKGKKGKVGKKCVSVGNKSKGGGAIQKYEGRNGNKGGGGVKNGKFSDFEVTKIHNKSGGGGGGGGGMGQYRAHGPPGPHPAQGRQMMMNMGGGGGGGGGMPMGQYRAAGPPQQQQGPQMMMNMGGGGNGYYNPSGIGGPMGQVNPYYQQQQQQYMAMMMNQQRMMDVGGGEVYHPAEYGRPYGPPVPPSPVRITGQEAYTNMFSDESTESCSIM